MSFILDGRDPWQCDLCGNPIDAATGGGICRFCRRDVCGRCGVASGPVLFGRLECRACRAPAEITPAERRTGNQSEIAPSEVRRA